MALDLKSVLSTRIEDAKRAPNIPPGTYKWVCAGASLQQASTGTQYIAFDLIMQEPQGDVNNDQFLMWKKALVEAKKDPDHFHHEHAAWFAKDESKMDNALVMLRDLLEKFGVSSNLSFEEGIMETKGKAIYGTVEHEAERNRPGEFRASIKSFAKV